MNIAVQCAVCSSVLFLVQPSVNAAVVCTYIHQPLIIIAFTFPLLAIFFIIANKNCATLEAQHFTPRKLVSRSLELA